MNVVVDAQTSSSAGVAGILRYQLGLVGSTKAPVEKVYEPLLGFVNVVPFGERAYTVTV